MCPGPWNGTSLARDKSFAALMRGEVSEAQVTVPLRDGVLRHCAGLAIPVKLDGGVVAALLRFAPVARYRDPSLRPRSGEWALDLSTGAMELSQGIRLALGKSFLEGAVSHARLHRLVHRADRAALRMALRPVLRGAANRFSLSVRLCLPENETVSCRLTGECVERTAPDRLPLLCGRALVQGSALSREDGAAMAEAEILRDASENGGVVPWHRVPEKGESWFGRNIAAMLGLPPETELTLAGFHARVHPEDVPAIAAGHSAIEAGERDDFEADFRVQHADGSWRWLFARGKRVERASEGLPDMICGSLTDITHRKQNEARLTRDVESARRARDRLNALVYNAPNALFECRIAADGTVGMPYIGAELPGIMGVRRAEIEADPNAFDRQVHPDDRPRLRQARESAIRDHRTASVRLRIVTGETGPRRVLVTMKPKAARGGALTLFGAVMDMTKEAEAERRAEQAAQEVRLAHERLITMAENTPGAVFEWHMAPDGGLRFAFFSAPLPDMLGVTRAALEADGRAVFTHVPQAEMAAIAAELQSARAGMRRFEIRHRVQHPETGLRWVLVSANPAPQPDGAVFWYGNTVDITAQVAAERQAAEAARDARRAHDRLRMVADIAPAGLYEYRRHPDGRTDFPYTSARFEDLTGYSRAEIEALADGMLGRVHSADLPELLARTEQSAQDLTPWQMRFRMTHPKRGLVWLQGASVPRREADGSTVWTGALHDVTGDVMREAELRRAHRLAEDMRAENERQALHDGLTGLPNRRYYDQMLARRLGEDAPHDCALIRIDLDHFKHVNDTLGHEAGDAVLVHVAHILRKSIRAGDFAARIGGDEFSILLGTSMTRFDATEIVHRIQERLAEPFSYAGRPCRFGASFGIAHVDDIAQVGEEIQIFADHALYRAKAGGRNRMEFFTPALHRELLEERDLGRQLHEALEQGAFLPHFQTQVSAKTGEIVGVETLLRWDHPERGLLAPSAFMGVAEQLRLVPEIDRLVMAKARDALRHWQAQGVKVPKISLNLSAGRLQDPDLISLACEMGKGGTRVAFELVESLLLEQDAAISGQLDMIRCAGIGIEIDEFGSGHGSIIGLMEIGPSALKIDKRIVAPVAEDSRLRTMVRAIVEIAQTLGIETVAGGVETPEQARILTGIGCDILQGFHFSRPMGAEHMLQHLGTARQSVA